MHEAMDWAVVRASSSVTPSIIPSLPISVSTVQFLLLHWYLCQTRNTATLCSVTCATSASRCMTSETSVTPIPLPSLPALSSCLPLNPHTRPHLWPLLTKCALLHNQSSVGLVVPLAVYVMLEFVRALVVSFYPAFRWSSLSFWCFMYQHFFRLSYCFSSVSSANTLASPSCNTE